MSPSPSSSLKGKGRAPAHPQPEPRESQSTPAPSKPAFRHGRGPIIPDDDEDPPNGVLVVNREGEGDDERTSLLYSAGANRSHESLAARPAQRRSAWKTCALVGAVSLAFVVLLLLALVHVWVGHVVKEQSKQGTMEDMVRKGVRLEGPFEFGVGEGQSENEVVVKLNASVGFDARSGLGWEDKDSKGANSLRRWESYFARRAVKMTDSVQLDFSNIVIFTDLPSGDEAPLVQVPSLDSIRVPLSYPHRTEGVQTTPLALSVPLRFPDPDAAAKFASKVWNTKKYNVKVMAEGVQVKVGKEGQKGLGGWAMRRFGERRVDTVQQVVEGKRKCSLDKIGRYLRLLNLIWLHF